MIDQKETLATDSGLETRRAAVGQPAPGIAPSSTNTLDFGRAVRRASWAILAIAALASAAVITLGGSAVPNNDPASGLLASAQSTQVELLQKQLPSGQTNPALIVYSRGGAPLTALDEQVINGQLGALDGVALGSHASPVQFAPDRSAAVVLVPLPVYADISKTSSTVETIRSIVRAGLPSGLVAQVTGGAGFSADLANAFSGANVTLLAVTVIVVAALLLVTYRSPVLWIVPLVTVGVADQVASGLIAVVSRHTTLAFNQSTTGIVEVLVFGAGTDYALLLIARYREELRRHADRYRAMLQALRRAGPAIAASGTTVILALLTLLAAVLGDDKAIGVAGAIGIATALAFGLAVLPAALVVLPRWIFWPRVPQADERGRQANASQGRGWRRVGEATSRRPWLVIAASLLLLGVMTTGLQGTKLGLSQTESFRTNAESVAGLKTLARSFPAGAADPVAVITTPRAADEVLAVVKSVPGVSDATLSAQTDTLAQIDVIIAAAPDTAASFDAIQALRTAVARVPNANALVGGTVATDYDIKRAATRDLMVIAPLILLVVFMVLAVLLRAIVAPLVLIATVIVSFFAALGAASWSFTHIFGFAGLDNQVPLLAFLFLVALGVDYNIFLVTRAREDAQREGTRRGVISALAVTGGVITSAGILLAAVFAVLGVLPVIVLTEVGLIVGLGVLLDTLLVRTVLVPALVLVLGDRFWLPSRGYGEASGQTA